MVIQRRVTHQEAGREHWWRRFTARKVAVCAFVAVLVLDAGGVALASIPATGTDVFHGCYSTTTGALRLIDSSAGQKCAAGQKAVSWDRSGITWDGPWKATTAYVAQDAVVYDGSSYIAIGSATGKVPTTSPYYWNLLAAGGKTGATGPARARGPAGTTGPAGPEGPARSPPEPNLSQVATLKGWGANESGGSYGFTHPYGIAFDGTHVRVTTFSGKSVTELPTG